MAFGGSFSHALGQMGDIFSGKPKDLTKTSQTTSGSAAGETAGTWGLDQYKGMMDPTAYGGNVPGAQGPNTAQTQQYNMLTGMNTGYGGPAGYQGKLNDIMGMNSQQIGAMDRSGGPGAYQSKYGDAMKGHLKKDYDESLAMMSNQVGSGAAGQNAFGGARHGVAEGVGGAKAMDNYLAAATRIDADSYDKGMNWMGQDQNRNIAITNANNQANLGFGAMNMAAGQNNMNNQMNMSNAFGNYGLNQQNQQNIADNFGYNEFNRMENWKPNMMNNYMAGVRGTPWQTSGSSTQQGQGKSDLMNMIGMGVGLGGAALSGGMFKA
jgi:hypothetical protein